eukprot:5185801-Pleurochrysis_carterae.AAC.1
MAHGDTLSSLRLEQCILSSTTKEGQAEKESVESTPHSPAKLIHFGGPDHSSACRKAEERGQTEALKHLMDAP